MTDHTKHDPVTAVRIGEAGHGPYVASDQAEPRFYDLRHHAITGLAEFQVSDQTIMAIAGHFSQEMLARYSHPAE